MKLLYHCRPDPEDVTCRKVKRPQLWRRASPVWEGEAFIPITFADPHQVPGQHCARAPSACTTSPPDLAAELPVPASLLFPSHPTALPKSLQERLS